MFAITYGMDEKKILAIASSTTTIILALFAGLIFTAIDTGALVFAQTNQTAGGNNTNTTAAPIANVTHGGGPGAGATNQSSK